jgi:fimbrial chaperone protein
MKTLTRAGLAGLLALAVPAAWAGVFSVTPVRIYLTPKDRATAITVQNEGDEEIVMQADVYTWQQKPGGEDDLQLSEDLVLSPPILKIGPKARQVVRLAMVSPPKAEQQLTYRLIVREIPEAKPVEKTIQLQVALAFSLPIFITPPNVKRELDCTVERSAPDKVAATCENKGQAYAQPRELALLDGAGQKVVSRDNGLYILPGIRRTFELRKADGPIPGGKLKLAVTLDDGSTQGYDIALPQ